MTTETTTIPAGNVPALQPVARGPEDGRVMNVMGHMARLLLSREDTGGAFSLFDYRSEAGSGVPPHVHHNEDEVWLVLEGALEVTVGGVTHRLEPGGMAFGPRGIEHGFQCVGDTPTRFILIASPGGFERFFADVDDAGGVMPVPQFVEIVRRHGMTMG
ncbi:MAG: cupin domain-containing protein [Phycisphaerales bacterium]|nr:cupin domain-containing protein [Planctomycetota bacterium]MCH8507394.1 cupin domain-containing protein [Phycisphaerales bacterium]